MINSFYKKIVVGLLITVMVVSPSLVGISTKKAQAQWVVFDVPNTIQGVIGAIENAATAIATYSLDYKELVLDGIANMVAKAILQRMTASVVNWINSGFQGSPSFVTNPGSFFADIGDQLTGAFISQSGLLSQLCSPFSIDLRIALSLNFGSSNRGQLRYACTLSTIIDSMKNSTVQTGISANASVDRFIRGDFNSGGWPAFIALTTEPQNNQYGAFVQAQSDLSRQINSSIQQQKDELFQGKGFLSFKTCKTVNVQVPTGGNNLVESTTRQEKICETQTPGAAIAGALDKQLGAPVDQLNLADEFNEIVNALFAQLVTQVLQGGLRSASSGGSGNLGAYTRQLQVEADTGGGSLENAKKALIDSIIPYLARAEGVVKDKSTTVTSVDEAKKTLDAEKLCYENRIASSTSAGEISAYQQKITMVDNVIQNEIVTVVASSNDAGAMLVLMRSLKAEAEAATSVEQLGSISERFSSLLRTQALTSGKNVVDAQTEAKDIADKLAPIVLDSNSRLSDCLSATTH